MPGKHGGIGERKTMTPEQAERVLAAGDRMQRGECRAGEKRRIVNGLPG